MAWPFPPGRDPRELPDTLTGRIQGVLDVKNVLRGVARAKQVQEAKRELLAGLCYQLQRIEPKRATLEEWGSF